jgi:glucokinase
MAVFDHDTKKILLGVGIGLGSAIAIPAVAGILAVVGRPLVKAALKHGVLAAERSRERLAIVAEGFEDLVAEVRAEVEEELAAKVEHATDAGAAPSARDAADVPSASTATNGRGIA